MSTHELVAAAAASQHPMYLPHAGAVQMDRLSGSIGHAIKGRYITGIACAWVKSVMADKRRQQHISSMW